MVSADKSGGNPSGDWKKGGGSPIGEAVLKSIGFGSSIFGRNPRLFFWYVLLADGRSVEGVLDAAKDEFLVRKGPFPPYDGRRTHRLKSKGATVSAEPEKWEVDVIETLQGFELAGSFESRRFIRRFAILYTASEELVEVDDSEIAYIQVSHRVSTDLAESYLKSRTNLHFALKYVERARKKIPDWRSAAFVSVEEPTSEE